MSGSIDILAIRQPDDSIKVSPFYIRFGRMHMFKTNKKLVDVVINGQKSGLVMKLGSAGEAFFVQKVPVSILQILTN